MTAPIFEARDITVEAGRRTIIEHCSFSAGAGEFIGIIGPNGSGKSTFLKAIRNLIPRKSGRVSFFGQDEANMGEKEIARRAAFMPQEFHVPFGYRCREIVAAARYPYLAWWQGESSKDKAIVDRAMQFTGVAHLADAVIQHVSGGERQRVLLAKILAQETPLIFLDEPTAALDLLYQEEIFRLCQRLSREGKTVIMICHDLTMAAKWCSRLLLLSHHTIQCDGRPREVLTKSNLKQFFGLDSIVYTDRVSGETSIYTYFPRQAEHPESVLLLGHGLETGTLIRLLYTAGHHVTCGYLPETSLAREIATDFHVSFLETPENLPAFLQQAPTIFAYGAEESELALLNQEAEEKSIYTDIPLPPIPTHPFEDIARDIAAGTWKP